MSKFADGAAPTATATPVRQRLLVVDLLRGLAIVLMALDHVREFLQAQQVDPLDLAKTTPALFFTRWVTHFCPSLFILLAGAAIALGLNGRRSKSEQARFVFVRGVWLVVLELTIVHLGWQFNFHFESALGQVIWVIGWSMICMAGLLYLPAPVVTALGLALICGHNAFDPIHADRFGKYGWVWQFLHDRGYISFEAKQLGLFGRPWQYLFDHGFLWFKQFGIYIAYPLIPWVGVMAAGFGFGRLLRWNSPARAWVISAMGIGMIVLFAILRGQNIYGDPAPWTAQETPVRTLIAILNCQKYPPSLSYLLMTLGPMLALWPLWERSRGPLARFLVTFGRVPLFFYAVHLFVIHGLTMAIVAAQVGLPLPGWLWGFPPGHAGENCGVSLPVLYLIWFGVVLLHYPLCRWFDALKSRYPNSVLKFM